MKFVRFYLDRTLSVRAGILNNDKLLDLSHIFGCDDPVVLSWLAKENDCVKRLYKEAPELDLTDVTLKCPIKRSSKFLFIGLNYFDHANEMNLKVPDEPICANKQLTALSYHLQPIILPSEVTTLDYEGEIAIVIGKKCRDVAVEDAREYIFGLTATNDISIRQWQFKSPTWTLGKSYDTHASVGPAIVTLDEFDDPTSVGVKTRINGELRQNGNSRDMIFNFFRLVSYISSRTTLLPGDIIATGTPPGVGNSFDPPKYLKDGDIVEVEVEKVGTLINKVVSEDKLAKSRVYLGEPGW